MLKSELVTRLAFKHSNLPERSLKNAVDIILERMTESLLSQDRIEIRGFGSFSVHYYPPRRAHNPRTKEYLTAGPCAKPHFKAGKALREKVKALHKKTKKDEK